MSAESYIKTNCPLCEGSIEIPVHGLGQIISCPHCEQNIKLSQKYPFQRFNQHGLFAKSAIFLFIAVLVVCAINYYQGQQAQQLVAQQEKANQEAAVKAAAFQEEQLQEANEHAAQLAAIAEQKRQQAIQMLGSVNAARQQIQNDSDANRQRWQQYEMLSALSDANDISRQAVRDNNFNYQQNYWQNQQALRDLNRLTQIQEDQNNRQILNGH